MKAHRSISQKESSHSQCSDRHTNSTRWTRTGNGNSPANQITETELEIEYTAPFTQPDRKNLVRPPVAAKPSTSSKTHADILIDDEAHYEGCDMSALNAGGRIRGKRIETTNPGVIGSQYSELEVIPEEYSHLEH